MAKATKCPHKTTKTINLPTEVITLKEEEDKTEEVEGGVTLKEVEKNSTFLPRVFCEFCGKEGYREERCYTQANCKKCKQQNINPVDEGSQDDQQSKHNQKYFFEANEEISSVFRTQPKKS